MSELTRIVLALAGGLLLGSVLPAELMARRRGVDIRSIGDGNPGLWNAFGGLGFGAGVVTAVYDLSIGVAVIVAARSLGVPESSAYLAGMMTVVGHRFPVFRGFKGGGQGMAACAGMILYGVAALVARGALPVSAVALLVAIGALTWTLTRRSSAIAITLMPALMVEVALAGAGRPLPALVLALSAYIWLVQVAMSRRSAFGAYPAETMRHAHR